MQSIISTDKNTLRRLIDFQPYVVAQAGRSNLPEKIFIRSYSLLENIYLRRLKRLFKFRNVRTVSVSLGHVDERYKYLLCIRSHRVNE